MLDAEQVALGVATTRREVDRQCDLAVDRPVERNRLAERQFVATECHRHVLRCDVTLGGQVECQVLQVGDVDTHVEATTELGKGRLPVEQVDTERVGELEVHRAGVVLDERGLGLEAERARGHVDRLARCLERVAAVLVGVRECAVLALDGCPDDGVALAVGHLALDGEVAVHDCLGCGGHVDDTGSVADIAAVERREVVVWLLRRLGERTLYQRRGEVLGGRGLDERDRTRDVGCSHRGTRREGVGGRRVTDVTAQRTRTQHANTGRTHVRLDVLTGVVVRELCAAADVDVVDAEPVDDCAAGEACDAAGLVRGTDGEPVELGTRRRCGATGVTGPLVAGRPDDDGPGGECILHLLFHQQFEHRVPGALHREPEAHARYI